MIQCKCHNLASYFLYNNNHDAACFCGIKASLAGFCRGLGCEMKGADPRVFPCTSKFYMNKKFINKNSISQDNILCQSQKFMWDGLMNQFRAKNLFIWITHENITIYYKY